MNEPAMPTPLVAHHRPGFYFRVLEEGVVEAGDEIEKVGDRPEQLTVADIGALLYLPTKSRQLLQRARRVTRTNAGLEPLNGAARFVATREIRGVEGPGRRRGCRPGVARSHECRARARAVAGVVPRPALHKSRSRRVAAPAPATRGHQGAGGPSCDGPLVHICLAAGQAGRG